MMEGNLRSLWRVAWPLMLGFLSWVGMMFVDRLFIGMYSPAALNAAVNAGTYAMAVTFGVDQLVRITAVFVSRRNGAGEQKRLGEAVWQGIWISVASIAFFVPLAIWAPDFLFDESTHGELCKTYFRWFMGLGPLAGFQAALSSYFVGQGRVGVVSIGILFGNLINLTLDPLLIFGWGPVASMGLAGAIIATGLGTLGQTFLLTVRFLRKEEREERGTFQWKLHLPLLREMVRVGFPAALFLLLELIGSGLFFSMMAGISKEYLLVAGIHQSLFLLLLFFGGGMEHGAQALAGNLIGAGKSDQLPKVLRAGMLLHLVYAALLGIMMWLFGGLFVDLFLQDSAGVDGAPLQLFSSESLKWISHMAWVGLGWLVVRLFLETASWLFNGVLRAAGDTLFPMLLGLVNIWLGLLLPTYFLMVKGEGSIQTAFLIWVFYGTCALAFSSLRFLYGTWKQKTLLASI